MSDKLNIEHINEVVERVEEYFKNHQGSIVTDDDIIEMMSILPELARINRVLVGIMKKTTSCLTCPDIDDCCGWNAPMDSDVKTLCSNNVSDYILNRLLEQAIKAEVERGE
jgi:hypothetical protein